MEIDISIEDPRWDNLGLDRVAETAALAVLARLGLDSEICELSVLGCDDDRIATLNADFRGKPQPTNVLSWPADERGPDIAGDLPQPPEPDAFGNIELGDIAISYDTCLQEAQAAGKPVNDHVLHLMIHATLHLLGFDHLRELDAALMERLEAEILGNFGIDDPYKDE